MPIKRRNSRSISNLILFAYYSLKMKSGFACVVAEECHVYECYESIDGVFGFSDHRLVFPFYSDLQLDEICRWVTNDIRTVVRGPSINKTAAIILCEELDLSDGLLDFTK